MDEFEDVPCCPICGTPMEWERCHAIGCEEGIIDAYEEDPLWYAPGDMERCSECGGTGGWYVCPEPQRHQT